MCLSSKVSHLTVQLQSRTAAGDRNPHEMEMFFIFLFLMFLTGLDCVVEYRSEDGCSYCFLCHCCRIKSNKKDITEHLTSPSHLINYWVCLFWISYQNGL